MKKWTLFANSLPDSAEHMLTAIKGTDEFYKYTVAQLPQKTEAEVLDLGCGTGLELEEYFLLNPKAHITCIDLSKVMLQTLAAKFPDRNLTLTSERKMSFYPKLLRSLKSNGFFVLTDYFAESEEFEKEISLSHVHLQYHAIYAILIGYLAWYGSIG